MYVNILRRHLNGLNHVKLTRFYPKIFKRLIFWIRYLSKLLNNKRSFSRDILRAQYRRKTLLYHESRFIQDISAASDSRHFKVLTDIF